MSESKLVKPILPSIAVYDASINNRLSFVVIGGSMFSEYYFEISNINTQDVVVSRSVVTTSTVISLESGLLSNGVDYKVRVRTENLTGQSEFSDYMILKCYKTAVVKINNIFEEDGIYKVNNQRYSFSGTYYQENGVGLKGYKYIFYSADNEIVKEYAITYQQSGDLVQFVGFLDNGKNYKVKLVCTDQNDIVTSSELIEFLVDYVPPRIKQLISTTNDSENASINIKCDIRQLMFETEGNTFFVDNEMINTMEDGSSIFMDQSFSMNSNFFMQLWLGEFKNNILELKNTTAEYNTKIELFYSDEDSRFHVRKYVGTIVMEYISEIIERDSAMHTSVIVLQDNRRIDIITELVGVG